jgi:hypothetical protein
MTSFRRSRKQIHSDFESIVLSLRDSPALLLPTQDLPTACVFLSGYDAALRGMPLSGFHHWLIVRAKGDRAHWIPQLQRLARRAAGPATSQQRVLREGLRILKAFLTYRSRFGLTVLMEKSMRLQARRLGRIARGGSRTAGRTARLPSNTSLERTRDR